MTGLKKSYDDNKLIYWIMGAMLTVILSFAGILRTDNNNRLDKIERSLANRPTREYLKDRLGDIDKKIEDNNISNAKQLERMSERQDETFDKINEVYIFMLKQKN